jgi:hypothetical protein
MSITKIPPSGIDTQALSGVLDISIGNLTEVDLTVAPSNGQALVYNSTSSTWKPGTVSGGGGGGSSTAATVGYSLVFGG